MEEDALSETRAPRWRLGINLAYWFAIAGLEIAEA